MDDSKIVVRHAATLELFDGVDPSIARPSPQLALEAGDIFRVAGGYHLDGTVATIADRTGDSQAHGRALHKPAEPDTLHLAANDKALAVLIFEGHGGSGYENFTRSTVQYFPEVYDFEQSTGGPDRFFTTIYEFGRPSASRIL